MIDISSVGRVVPSNFVDLGEIEQNWHTPEYDRNIQANCQFETIIGENDELVVAAIGRLTINRATMSNGRTTEDEALVGNLGRVVSQIDTYYRQYREIPSDTTLMHDVVYKVGRIRGGAAIHHSLTGNLLPFCGPGTTHFDSFIKDSDEAVMINHKGNPTRVFIGPVRKFGNDSNWSRLSRLTALASVKVPHDRAILFDRDTLHQQSPQFNLLFNRGVFLRDIITILSNTAADRTRTSNVRNRQI